jgi:hypothetical protein
MRISQFSMAPVELAMTAAHKMMKRATNKRTITQGRVHGSWLLAVVM